MMDSLCPQCGATSSEVLEVLLDQRRRLYCDDCNKPFLAGTAQPVPSPSTASTRRAGSVRAYDAARPAFSKTDQVDPARRERVETLKARFLDEHPQPEVGVAAFWEDYQKVFSRDGLSRPDVTKLHRFANSQVGASVGPMTNFNNAFNELGPQEAARRVVEASAYVLYGEQGPAEEHPEDRLTYLLQQDSPLGVKGWREALLTKTLAVVEPQRIIPIVTYESSRDLGKRAMAARIWGLTLPAPDRTSMTLGRLIYWSNDLLLELAGDGFAHAQHVSQFLWWIKDFPEQLEGRHDP